MNLYQLTRISSKISGSSPDTSAFGAVHGYAYPLPDPQYGAYFKKRAEQACNNQQCRTSFQRLAAFLACASYVWKILWGSGGLVQSFEDPHASTIAGDH